MHIKCPRCGRIVELPECMDIDEAVVCTEYNERSEIARLIR